MKRFEEVFPILKETIDDLRTIDCHTHIDPKVPLASGSSDIVMYHYIVTELLSTGVPNALIETARDDISILASHFGKIDNTNTFKMLVRIVKDLFGMAINESTNWQKLDSVIVAANACPERSKELQKNISHIEKSILTYSVFDFCRQEDKDAFVNSVRIEPLIYDITTCQTRDEVEAITGRPVKSLQDAADAVECIIDNAVSQEGRIFGLDIRPELIYTQVTLNQATSAFSHAVSEKDDGDEKSKDIVAIYMLNTILKRLARENIVLQLFYGIKRPIAGGRSLVHFNAESMLSLSLMFEMYKTVKFEMLIATPSLLHNASILSKCFPNVFINCNWWYANYPYYLKRSIEEQIEILPKIKIHGFYSDAYNMEWSYGKLRVYKDSLCEVLTKKIITNYFTMEEAVKFAEDILYNNPNSFYEL